MNVRQRMTVSSLCFLFAALVLLMRFLPAYAAWLYLAGMVVLCVAVVIALRNTPNIRSAFWLWTSVVFGIIVASGIVGFLLARAS